MNLNVDTRYQNAVVQFVWLESTENLILSVPHSSLEQVVDEIAKKILAAIDLRPNLNDMAQRNISLLEACYLTVQDLDLKIGKDAAIAIEKASNEEKIVLDYLVRRLTKPFQEVPHEDLKAATLLFGIHRVQELAAKKIIVTPIQIPRVENLEIENLEKDLSDLIDLRSKYSAEIIEQGGKLIQDFIVLKDKEIKDRTSQLQMLKKAEQKK